MKTSYLVAVLAGLAMMAATPLHAQHKDVIEEWQNVQAPKAPESVRQWWPDLEC